MHLPKLVPLATALIVGVLGLAVACAQAATPEGDCLVAEDGKLVPASCIVEGAAAPTPTFTPTEPNGNGDVPTATPSGLHPGLQVFIREGTCFTCHIIDGVPQTIGQIGPNLTHIGTKEAATPGYIRESIIDPNAVIAPDCPTGPCPSGLMLPNFAQVLTEQQIQDLVDYLSGLK